MVGLTRSPFGPPLILHCRIPSFTIQRAMAATLLGETIDKITKLRNAANEE
jgi:hypothetical protein